MSALSGIGEEYLESPVEVSGRNPRQLREINEVDCTAQEKSRSSSPPQAGSRRLVKVQDVAAQRRCDFRHSRRKRSHTLVTGKLSRVSAERVGVFPRRTINIRDLDDETLARLYLFTMKMVKEYVASENRRYDTQIEVYMMDERRRRVRTLPQGWLHPQPGLDMTARRSG